MGLSAYRMYGLIDISRPEMLITGYKMFYITKEMRTSLNRFLVLKLFAKRRYFVYYCGRLVLILDMILLPFIHRIFPKPFPKTEYIYLKCSDIITFINIFTFVSAKNHLIPPLGKMPLLLFIGHVS